MLNPLPSSPLWLLAPGLIGASVGFALVTVAADAPPDSAKFVSQPPYHLWRLLMMAQTTYIAGALLPVAGRLRRVCRATDTTGHWPLLALALALLLAFYFLPAAFSPVEQFPLNRHKLRMVVMLSLAAVIAVMAICGLLVLYLRFGQLPANPAAVGAYLDARADVTWLMSVVGIMVGLGTLATGALSKTLDAFYGVDERANPLVTSEMVVAYGAYLTLMLAIVYVPVYTAQRAAGERLRAQLLEDRSSEEQDVVARQRLRRELGEMLQLGAGPREGLQANLAIFSPLLAALLSGLLKLG